jgi:hypothetical protein
LTVAASRLNIDGEVGSEDVALGLKERGPSARIAAPFTTKSSPEIENLL